MDRLSYYDTLANLIPGSVLLWALLAANPLDAGAMKSYMTGNAAIDVLLFVALAYTTGHVLQFLSRCTVEPLIKAAFWHGAFFSDVFLVSSTGVCREPELSRYLRAAQEQLGFSAEDLQPLRGRQTKMDGEKREAASAASRAVYRALDARTLDRGTALKAHTQNAVYGMFRNLSTVFLVLLIITVAHLAVSPEARTGATAGLLVLYSGLTVVFLLQAKRRGELYVRGLFWSLE